MAGASTLMSIGLRGMLANSAALQTTGHNITNAGVDGYSRQTVELATAKGQFTGAGFFGKGVDVKTVTRAHDEYLTREAAGTKSLSSMDKARHEALQQLEAVFPIGSSGIGQAMGDFLNAATDVASKPGDLPSRQVLLARATDTATRFATAAGQLDSIQTGLKEQLGDEVNTVNSLTASIAEVNQRILSLKSLGQPANDLLDQRDQLVSQLSEHVQVTTITGDDGTMGVFVGGGQRLVLGVEASKVQLVADPEDSTRAAIALQDSGFLRTLTDGTLGAGRMSGLLEVQNHDLVDARNQLGQMAAAFAAAVNGQQALGLDMGDPPGAGAAVFSVGGPRVVPNTHNERNATGGFVAQPSVTITDASQLVASDYELRADPAGVAGNWQLTRRSDGLVRTVQDGDTVDGFTLSLGSPVPYAEDRFLLQPVGRSAADMAMVLDDARGIAAASPVTATVGSANTGSASVAALKAVSTSLDPQNTATITFTSGTGDYSWELRDRTSNALVSSGTGTWTAGTPITLNGFELSLNGVPRSGDTVTVAKTAYPGANNGNALALVGLRDMALVGRSLQSDGTLGGGLSFTEAYASAMADVGVRVQGAKVSADVSAGVAAQAEQARAARAGVNLDEEAARLLAFQQSYQASAKILQVAQTVFDTLLDMAR